MILPKKYLFFFAAVIIWVVFYLSLEALAESLAFSILPFEKGTPLGEAVYFFMYEVPKVLLLLTIVVFSVGIIRSYFSPERTRAILGKKSLFAGNVLGSLLGVVTPFCSCSAIPLFLGFVKAGVPLGATFSFLIAAPMVNEVALVLLFGLFGWQTAGLYAATGLLIAVFSGFAIGKLKMEKYVQDWVYDIKAGEGIAQNERIPFSERIETGIDAVKEIVAKVWMYIIIGIAVGAGIHGYVPENFMAALMGKSAWWSVPVSVLIGVPMYSNAAGIIPVVQALLGKGAALGTVLAFMMSVIALSLPEIIILKKVLKMRLIIVFVGIVASGIIFVGYLFNFIF